MGLSSLHKRTQLIPAQAIVYEAGSLATVRREHEQKECLKCGRPFKALVRRSDEKHVCRSCETVKKTCKECGACWLGERWPRDAEGKAKVVGCPKCGAVHNGNRRQAVTRFSENSRRRLMRKLATVKTGELPCFVTLTYPDSWTYHDDPHMWKTTLKRFEARFRRRFEAGAYLWRLEVVPRKSGERLGELSPHYHLLVFGVSYAQLREFVPVAWYEAVGTGDEKHLQAGVQVARVHSRRGVMAYASKAVGRTMGAEMGKTVQAQAGRVGRWWGVAMRENFEAVVSAVKALDLTEQEAVQLLRAFRRLSKVRGRDYPSLTAFIDGAFLLLCLPRIAIPDVGRGFYKATRRPYEQTFSEFVGGA